MKRSAVILIEKNTENLSTRIDFLVDYFYMLQSGARRIVELLGFSLLQMRIKRSECLAIIIIYHEIKTQDTEDQRDYMTSFCPKNLLFCPIRLVGMELFWCLKISKEKPPNLNNRKI